MSKRYLGEEIDIHAGGEDLIFPHHENEIAIYKKCADYALTKGIIIADTKFEFGLDENGNMVLGDEVLQFLSAS